MNFPDEMKDAKVSLLSVLLLITQKKNLSLLSLESFPGHVLFPVGIMFTGSKMSRFDRVRNILYPFVLKKKKKLSTFLEELILALDF